MSLTKNPKSKTKIFFILIWKTSRIFRGFEQLSKLNLLPSYGWPNFALREQVIPFCNFSIFVET